MEAGDCMTQFRRRSLGKPVSGFLAEIHFADHVALTGMIQSPFTPTSSQAQGRSCDRPTAGESEWVTGPMPGFARAGFMNGIDTREIVVNL